MYRAFLIVTLAGALGSASIPAAGPSAVLLARNRTEPIVASDPRNPATVIVASNTNYSAPVGGTYPTALFTSHDSGRTFAFQNAPIVSPYSTGADSSVAIDANGTVFYSYLGETPAYCSGGRSAVILTHSTDSGRSFRPGRVVDSNPADDKPFMAVRTAPHGTAHVFLSWTRWYSKTSDIVFARSTNGGASFYPPAVLHDSSADNFGSVPVAGPNNRVYVFWSVFPQTSLTAIAPTSIVMRASSDGGAHFGPARPVVPAFRGMPHMALPGYLRNFTNPAVVAGSDGTLYLSWSEVTRKYGDGHVDSDIMISRSVDGGAHWSRPRRVNDVRRNDRFMPALAMLGPQTVGVAFYDRRDSLSDLNIYAARVSYSAGFHAYRNMRVNGGSSPISDVYYIKPGSTCFSPGRFFGDYIGAAPSGGQLCVVWADTRLHTRNETDLWFARASLPGPTNRRREALQMLIMPRRVPQDAGWVWLQAVPRQRATTATLKQ